MPMLILQTLETESSLEVLINETRVFSPITGVLGEKLLDSFRFTAHLHRAALSVITQKRLHRDIKYRKSRGALNVGEDICCSCANPRFLNGWREIFSHPSFCDFLLLGRSFLMRRIAEMCHAIFGFAVTGIMTANE